MCLFSEKSSNRGGLHMGVDRNLLLMRLKEVFG